MSIDSRTRITGLIGHPVEHSLSPAMHNSAYEHLGLNYCYIALPVHPDSLTRAIEGIRALSFRGVNVTVPHKEMVIRSLEEVDDEALFIGAVNTVVNNDGRLKGYNTDGRGFIRSLEEENIHYKDKRIIVLGTGGAARAVCYYLAKEASELYLYDIDIEKARSLVSDLSDLGGKVFQAESTEKAADADIIINATPLGLRPTDPIPINEGLMAPDMKVIDLIYWDTPLLVAAKDAGCTVMNGLGMLLWQGALAFELWTGKSAPVDVMKNALVSGLASK
ncbi:MAG: shikimate dehydrogenase [Nitrospirota bacterium]|nr:MAG: shikimate dehydrogenase [Nitrospirota bacterium]